MGSHFVNLFYQVVLFCIRVADRTDLNLVRIPGKLSLTSLPEEEEDKDCTWR